MQKILILSGIIPERINMMETVGVKVIACGIEVFYTGELLTPWLFENKPFLICIAKLFHYF
jgi:hypothetical protein